MKIAYYGYIYENMTSNKTLIVVDIQPEYENYMKFKPYQFTQWLNENSSEYNRIVFLFNGPDLGFPSEHEYIGWLLENDLNEELLNEIQFYDKGYNFFRNAIDAGLDTIEIVKLIKYMIDNNINDSRDIKQWQTLNLDPSVIETLEDNEDSINIPDVLHYLTDIPGDLYICGGGKNECLLEVELCLQAKDRNYTKLNQWIY